MRVKNICGIKKRVFFIILLIVMQFIKLFNGMSQPTYPSIMMNPNVTIQTPTLTFGNIKQLRVERDFIFRLSTTGKLVIWSAKYRTLLVSMFDGQSEYPLQSCLQFDLASDDETLVVYTQSQKVLVLNLKQSGALTTVSQFIPTYSISNTSSLTFRDIEISHNNQIVIFSGLNSGQSLIQRFTINGVNIGTGYKIILANISQLYNLNTCEVGLVGGNKVYYLAVWKDDCFFEIDECVVGGSCVIKTQYQSAQCTQADLSNNITTNFKLQFSNDCSQIIFSSKSQGYGVYDIAQQQFYTFFQSTKSVQLSSIKYTQSFGYKSIFHFTHNGAFFVNQYGPVIDQNVVKTVVNQYGPKSAFSLENLFLVTADDTSLLFYEFYCQDATLFLVSSAMCMPCPQFCTTCDINGQCQACLTNYTLLSANNTCIPTTSGQTNTTIDNNQTLPNNTNTTNNITIQNNNSTNTNTNPQPQPQQQQQLTPTYKQIITVEPKYQFQSTISSLIESDSTQGVINASVFSLGMLQLFPFSFLFMRFINFWSICSFYLFLGVKMPTYLYNILQEIYKGINVSIFQTLGVQIKINIALNEKVDGWLNECFGISSDFLNANIENIVLLIFSYIVLWGLYVLKQNLEKNNILRRGLQKIDLPMAVIGQYVAIMNGFFLVMPVIKSQSYHTSFSQKANMSLHIFFILISLTIIGFAISYVSNCQCRSNQKSQKIIQVSDGQQLRQWTINCLCNSLLPALAVFGNIIVYLIFNTGLFALLLYSGMKVKQFRVNSIILVLQLILFHIAFIVLAIFDSQQYPLTFHFSAMCLVVIIFLGAIHQLASFLLSIVYAIYCSIKSYFSSVANLQSQMVIQKGQKTDADISQNQSQNIQLKKKSTMIGLKKILSYSPGDSLQIQSMNQTNHETSKSIFKKHKEWTKKQPKKAKKAVKFDIDQIKNHYHFKKALGSNPQSLDSPQLVSIPQKTIRRRRPYFTKFKNSIKPQLKVRQMQQINTDNNKIEKHVNILQKEKTDFPIIKHARDLSLYQMKSMKLIENEKKSITPSESQKPQSSIYVSTKSIKNNFKIETFNLNNNQLTE